VSDRDPPAIADKMIVALVDLDASLLQPMRLQTVRLNCLVQIRFRLDAGCELVRGAEFLAVCHEHGAPFGGRKILHDAAAHDGTLGQPAQPFV
jgi:hypothetical protein